MSRYIEVELPKNFMNVGITVSGELVADTNDSSNWDTLKVPLPKGRWRVHSYNTKMTGDIRKTIIELVDSRNWLMRFLGI